MSIHHDRCVTVNPAYRGGASAITHCRSPLRKHGLPQAQRGFTLIEVMIVVAVVAILAAIALPSYQGQVRKSRRAEAQSHLMALAGRQQQFLVDTRAYADTVGGIGIATPANVANAYILTLDVPAGATPPSFTITATPQGSQTQEPCGTLSLSNTGARTAATSGCW
jgi:type IV pilus assembly protein PilE